MRNFDGLQGGYLAHVLPSVLGHGVLNLQVVSVDQTDTGIRRDFHVARRQNGNASLPGNYECTCARRGNREFELQLGLCCVMNE